LPVFSETTFTRWCGTLTIAGGKSDDNLQVSMTDTRTGIARESIRESGVP